MTEQQQTACERAERIRTLREVLRGLRAERDTTQLRAIIASVEQLLRDTVAQEEDEKP